jgi:hypothetical protein
LILPVTSALVQRVQSGIELLQEALNFTALLRVRDFLKPLYQLLLLGEELREGRHCVTSLMLINARSDL